MKAIFIDCYLKGNDIVLWIKYQDKNLKVIDRFVPKIYVSGTNLKTWQKKLRDFNIISYFTKKKTFFQGKEIYVLKIPIYNLPDYNKIPREIEKISKYDLEIYNAGLKLEELYMFCKDIFPTGEVEVMLNGSNVLSIKPLESPNKINYTLPNFSIARLEIKSNNSLAKTLDTELLCLKINDLEITGNEKEILEKFKSVFLKLDPDIISSKDGNLMLPYIKERFKKHNIAFDFSRFEEDDFEFKQGESYWVYSSLIYRAHSIFLKGRLNMDSKSFFADDTGYFGIMEGSRVCRQRIQKTAMRSAGAAMTNCLLYEADKRNFLLPYKIGIYERFKTLKELYAADRGPVTFEPNIGFHTGAIELDFASLYPQIMWRKNLSPETLFCRCCKKNKVPGLHYNFCTKKRGLLSVVAERLVQRRMEIKKLGTKESKEKADYLKWLLVTLFGYQAFKDKKIGSIEIHESIQAYAREILMQTVRIAEDLGFEVIHGIVDSIYVKKKGFQNQDALKLQQEIIDKTGFIINLEGTYRWIVFLPSISNINQPVSSHYYGVLDDGKFKFRGIEARRSNSPKIIKDLQEEIIKALSCCKSKEEFLSQIPVAVSILKKYIKKIPNESPVNLKISKRISKKDYSVNIAQRFVVEQLEEEGFNINPGQKIEYIIRDSKNSNPKKRYLAYELIEPSDYDSKAKYKIQLDILKYQDLMIKSVHNLFLPFGVTKKNILEQLNLNNQEKLMP